MQLVLDIGNTRHKAVLFDGAIIKDHTAFAQPEQLEKMMPYVDEAIICRSGALPAWVKYLLPDKTLVISSELKWPFTTSYEQPEKLGPDRVALLAGLCEEPLFLPTVVIDFGTCITIDLITPTHHHVGGIIAPGLNMRLQAMHKFTNALPDLALPDAEQHLPLLGINTQSCMYSGVINAAVAEIDGLLAALRQQNGPLDIVITGGNHAIFEKRLKAGIFAQPFLLAQGCRFLLELNA